MFTENVFFVNETFNNKENIPLINKTSLTNSGNIKYNNIKNDVRFFQMIIESIPVLNIYK